MKKIICILIIISIFMSFSNLALAEDRQGNVTIEKARLAASQLIENTTYYEKWNNSSLEKKYDLYDIDDSILGYYFEVIKDSNALGYIIISATENRSPVLEYGEGSLSQKFTSKMSKGDKIYYLGALKYIYAKNQTDLNTKFENRKAQILNELKINGKQDEFAKVEKQILKSVKKNDNNVELWNEIENNQRSSMSLSLAPAKVLEVDRVWQRMTGVTNPDSSCGPTSAVMIVEYLRNKQGYLGFNGSGSYGGLSGFINHFYGKMSSNMFGTTMENWRQAMYLHLNLNYSTSPWRVSTTRADVSGASTTFIQKIEENRPVGLRFDFFVEDGTYVNYHFVTGMAYDNFTGLKVGVKDPDMGQSTTATQWFDWNTNDQDMAMGYIWYFQ